jgi:DnaJ like chaperone protein
MANFAKWIGGGLGFYVYGPTGGLLGFLLGSFFDETLSSSNQRQSVQVVNRSFRINLLILIASVMNADGKVVKAELDYVKQFLVRQFGEADAKEAVKSLKDILKQKLQIRDASLEVRSVLDYSSRMQLLHVLFNIAASDKTIGTSETNNIDLIAGYFGILSADYQSVKDIYIPRTEASYKVLESDPSASNDEIKRAYRKLAMKYHPDKVSHLGEENRENAEDKFKKLNEAYEMVKKERNMV